MKVLVTGGCGLIGFHAAKYYHEQGHEVEVVDNLERSKLLGHNEVLGKRIRHNWDLLKGKGIPVHLYDVSNEDQLFRLSGHDAIIHMAGQCGVPTSIADPRRDFEINTVGTFNVLEYARRHGSKVAFASTNKVYPIHGGFKKDGYRWNFDNIAWATNGFPENNTLVGARTPYGNSKMAADLMCQEWAHTYGVKTGVFRMSCIYGPNQFGFEEQGWATWFAIAQASQLPITIYGDGHQVRDMLYVEDCVKAYNAFIESEVDHGVWNLGGGVHNTTTLVEHLERLERMTHSANPPTSYEDWRPLDQKCYVTDICKIQTQLGWEPKVGVEEGTQRTLDWVLENRDIF
jgi:CDP-paratose 2-epimerase